MVMPAVVSDPLPHKQALRATSDADLLTAALLTGHDELMLAEFKYGGVPKETFEFITGSQAVPRKAFYHLKKDIFPAVYWNAFLKGTWYGPSGLFRPNTSASS